ncbi:hypothetical protein [uncultured Tateyamaria sp.]|uniref:hypothetical protein n=1 Tax=uncultured Tateyamaria sp. TaxID=455651 RepID=UPI00261A241B|nr:hypothetical protein [uncultured Tateyamaria sp.]
MHIPLSRDEIAAFLQVAPVQLDLLWRRGLLQRSLHCTHRPIAALSYSTIYDVLEFALAAGVLPVRLSKECAALWVAQLAEADELDEFEHASTNRRTALMMEAAIDDGLAAITRDPMHVVHVILATQAILYERCSDQRIAC